MQCVNTNLREYQTLKRESGLSDSELSHLVGTYLDTVGRYPYLDEIDGANSEPAIKEDLKLNKDNITDTENVLLATNTDNIDDAVLKLNDKYRDKEIEIETYGDNLAKVFITERPGLNPKDASLYDPIESEMNVIKQKAIADGTFMKAPNGKDTNLTERQWLQVRTKAFKNWFGDWEKATKNNPYSTEITIGNVSPDYDSADMNGAGAMFPIYKNGKYIGSIAINAYYRKGDNIEPWGEKRTNYVSMSSVGDAVEIEKEFRGKGYGKAAYFEFAKQMANMGYVLRSAPAKSRTEASTRVWKSLVRDGYAKEVGDRYEIINSSLTNASKVVDENGEPLVVWHGSKISNKITVFNNIPTYFADRYTAFSYTPFEAEDETKYMYPTFLNIRNPKQVDGKGAFWNNINGMTTDDIVKSINEEDGAIISNIKDYSDFTPGNPDLSLDLLKDAPLHTDYITTNPNQIKSAENNSGQFSITNNDITDNEVNSFHYFNEIIDRLNTLYGINVIPITNAELKDSELGSVAGTAKAFIYNGDIYVNTDIATVDSPVHEFLHILFGSMKYSNRNMYNQIVSSAELFESYQEIALEYPNRTREDINEEVFVTELAKYLTLGSKNIDKLPNSLKHEIFYNINRTLDTMLMGDLSVKCVDQLYLMNLKTLSRLVNANLTSFQTSLNNAMLSRIMSNKKQELMSEGLLREECS